MRLRHFHVAYLDKASGSLPPPPPSSPPSISPSASHSSSAAIPRPPALHQCLRPLAPKISFPAEARKMVVLPEFGRVVRNTSSRLLLNDCTVQAVPTGGTTRWNPSPDQIRVLETLYRGGMRTPNSFQIEQITEELGKFGRIEGKNVFYWFQNHKARERQKQKRAALLTLSTTTSTLLPAADDEAKEQDGVVESKKEEACEDASSSRKRRCRTWDDVVHGGGGDAATEVADDYYADDVTLELFPLRPQGKAS